MPMGKPFPVATEDQASPAARSIEELHERIIAMRNEKPPEYVAPALHPAIAENTRLEMEEGAKRVAYIENERAKLLQPKPEVESTPVYRPAEYVPDMNHGFVAGKTLKGG
jgi:hypothetical protein